MIRRLGALLATLWVVALLGACAVPPAVPLGTPRAEVIERLGRPTAVHPLPVGERLQYSYQPQGVVVYNLDLDAAGRLAAIDQPLRRDQFGRLVIDQTTRADLRLLYGEPAAVEKVARFNGDIWTYRFQDNGENWFLFLHLDPGGVLRQIMTAEERPVRDAHAH